MVVEWNLDEVGWRSEVDLRLFLYGELSFSYASGVMLYIWDGSEESTKFAIFGSFSSDNVFEEQNVVGCEVVMMECNEEPLMKRRKKEDLNGVHLKGDQFVHIYCVFK